MTDSPLVSKLIKWESIENRISTFSEHLTEILDTTRDKVDVVLGYDNSELMSDEVRSKIMYLFELIQVIESSPSLWSPHQILFKELRWLNVWWNNTQEWLPNTEVQKYTNRRDIILSWDMEAIKESCNVLLHIYHWDFS